MINNENLNKMYDGLIEGKELTTKELNSYGFNSKDLTDLVREGTLERIKRGYYTLVSTDSFFHYGKQLLALKEYERATTCFEKCYALNPNHPRVCFQLFLRSIQKRDYEKAFEYFQYFQNSENQYYNSDSNFYLYLLNMITEMPEKYREYVKYLQLKDMQIDYNDKRFKDPYEQNKVRISAFNQKFSLAARQLNKIENQQGRINAQGILTRALLSQAIEIQNDLKKEITKLALEQKYNEMISRLEEIEKRHPLSQIDESIAYLAKEISKIKETGIIPKKENISTNNLFEAIYAKNFELALSLSSSYIERRNIDESDNALFILLKEITKLIKAKKNSCSEQVEASTVPKINTTPMKTSITFTTVVNYLMQQDFDNSFRALKKYLKDRNKSEYEFLIVNLMKISLMEQDMSFSKPMIALTYISRENFIFDISEYIQDFYETLAQNRFPEARIYLDIISKSNKLGQECVVTDSLEQILNKTEKMLNYKGNNEVLDKIDTFIKLVEQEPIIQVPTQPPMLNAHVYADDMLEVKTIENVAVSTPQRKEERIAKQAVPEYDDFEFIKSKLDELYKNGIIVLRPMDENRRKGIHNIVDSIPKVVSFSIGETHNRQIVLRFKPYIDECADLRVIIREGNSAYKNGDYDTCIKSYRKLLEFGEPKAVIYAKLGLAYMKKHEKELAIDYLTVATALSKKEQTDFDFTELIASLKGLIAPEDKKPKVRMSIEDFSNDNENYYGIENMNELAELIASGINIDDACVALELNDEQKAIATLILARECYSQENYTMGDQYLKKVERTKNKSQFVTSLFEEVRKTKRFYKNRVSENYKPLLLTLKLRNH